MKFIIVALALMGVAESAENCKLSSDYCSLCPKGETHVACDPPLPSKCSEYTDVSFTQFTPELQDYILYLHNVDRNIIASGSDRHFYPAARMATVSWNCELAYLAQKNVEQCAQQHDPCRRIDGDPWVGQNLAYVANYGEFYDDKTAINMSIALWFNEKENAYWKDIDELPDDIENIGHFTQMVRDRSWSLGCAVAKYVSDDGYYYHQMACNYWFGNIYGLPVYDTSNRPGSGCTTGTNPDFNSLCSSAEKYDFGGLIPYDK